MSREKSARVLRSSWSSFLNTLESVYFSQDKIAQLRAIDPLDGNFKSKLEDGVANLPPNATLDEMGIAASCFLFRKTLPATMTTKEAVSAFVKKAGLPDRPSGDRWKQSAKDVVERLFPVGWDRQYARYAVKERANPTASLERGLSARLDIELSTTWENFVSAPVAGDHKCFPNEACRFCSDLRDVKKDRKVIGLQEGPKVRVITISDSWHCQLMPFHHLLYDHLRTNRWLLDGEPTPASLSSPDEVLSNGKTHVFVSGDYEAATDSFSCANSTYMIDLIQSRSSFIPPEVFDLARSRMDGGDLYIGKRKAGSRTTMQLMGDYLSFPLLCLCNFIGFIHSLGASGWTIAERGFLLINGDDIVFRCHRDLVGYWMDGVKEAGLTLSKGKTLVHRSFFSINSTFFVGSFRRFERSEVFRRFHVSRVPVIRWKSWSQTLRSFWGKAARMVTDAGPRVRSFLHRYIAHGHTVLRKGAQHDIHSFPSFELLRSSPLPGPARHALEWASRHPRLTRTFSFLDDPRPEGPAPDPDPHASWFRPWGRCGKDLEMQPFYSGPPPSTLMYSEEFVDPSWGSRYFLEQFKGTYSQKRVIKRWTHVARVNMNWGSAPLRVDLDPRPTPLLPSHTLFSVPARLHKLLRSVEQSTGLTIPLIGRTPRSGIGATVTSVIFPDPPPPRAPEFSGTMRPDQWAVAVSDWLLDETSSVRALWS